MFVLGEAEQNAMVVVNIAEEAFGIEREVELDTKFMKVS